MNNDNEELKSLKSIISDDSKTLDNQENFLNDNNDNDNNTPNSENNNITNSNSKEIIKTEKQSDEKPASFLEKVVINDREISFNELYESHLKTIEEKTKLKRKYIYSIIGLSFFFFFIGHFEIFFTYLLTAYFPIIWTYQEYKAKKEDYLKMWGSYWVIFIIFGVFDFFYKSFIEYVPFYFVVRTSVLLILYLPCFKGAIAIYHSVFVEVIRLTSLYKGKYNEKNSMLTEYKNRIKAKKE